MNMAVAFIEIVIAGTQASIWVSLLWVSVFGGAIFNPAKSALTDLPISLTATALFAVVYTLGVFVDRIGDGISAFLKPRETLLKASVFKKWTDKAHADKRLPIFLAEGKASSLLRIPGRIPGTPY
jgi:hypothetical protein